MINEHRFDSRETLLSRLYDEVVGCVMADLNERGEASLLLSGGSTPGPLYKRLSTAELDWSKVSVALVDERWVAADHAASNERFIEQTLRRNRAAACTLIGMKNIAATPFAGQLECHQRYAQVARPYSFCLLGMGGDGHTASLFPHADGLEEALSSEQLCAGIEAQPSAVTGEFLQRMTMTPWAFLQSKKVALLITGDDKWQVYQQARESGPVADMPVRALWQQHDVEQHDVEVDVFWAP